MTSAEQGSTITCVVCMNATGLFVPPMMIFPRKRDHPQLMNGAPPGVIHACHPSDGHTSHTRNIDFIYLARENHVRLLSIPPQSSHKMQPLDKTFMSPLKKHLTEEIRRWVRVKAKAITYYDMAEIFGHAYTRAQCTKLAINGFRATGIYPLNRYIFKDHDFIHESQLTADESNNNLSTNRNEDKTVVQPEEQSTSDDSAFVPNLSPGPSTAPAFITPEKSNTTFEEDK